MSLIATIRKLIPTPVKRSIKPLLPSELTAAAVHRDKQDSRDETWQYPGVSWFKLATVIQTADRCGLTTVQKPEYTEFLKTRTREVHDWLVFRRNVEAVPGR
jgi:hypothetical protein